MFAKKLPTGFRVAGFFLFFLCSILLAAFMVPYAVVPRALLGALCGALAGAFAYGTLPTKENLTLLRRQLQDNSLPKEINYMSPSELAMSYVKWCALCIAICAGMQIFATLAE